MYVHITTTPKTPLKSALYPELTIPDAISFLIHVGIWVQGYLQPDTVGGPEVSLCMDIYEGYVVRVEDFTTPNFSLLAEFSQHKALNSLLIYVARQGLSSYMYIHVVYKTH